MPARFSGYLLFILLALQFACAKKAPVERAAAAPRQAVICLDGVSYDLMQELRAEGHFSYLQNVSGLITTFPSLTNPAMVAILAPHGAPRAHGYEDLFYDKAENKIKGGLFARLTGNNLIKGTFRQLFHYHPSVPVMTIEYTMPPFSCWAEARASVARLDDKLLDSRERLYLAYVGATDCVSHTGGKGMVKNVLRALDKSLERALKRDGQLEIALFSDHGNAFGKYKRISFDESLERAGFKVEDKVSGPQSVALPLYGLVGSAVFHTSSENVEKLARAVAESKGVDFACYRDGEPIVVMSRRGRARVIKRGENYGYIDEQGDPLELKPVLSEMQRRGLLGADGTAADRAWFEMTGDHIYPDPLHRLWHAFGDYVANEASVIASLKEGRFAGNSALDLFVALKATHGSLTRDQSLGFAASSARRLPERLRGEQLWSYLSR